jgi:aminocarboxymuconate-semialdehyde decarboxylase
MARERLARSLCLSNPPRLRLVPSARNTAEEELPMNRPRTLDVHTHVLTEEMIGRIGKEAPKVAPRMTAIDADSVLLEIAGTPYRPFPRGGFDIERRFADMDAAEVDVQVLSATPQSYLYGEDPSLTLTCSIIQNNAIAKLVAAHPHRFLGIATLPMQAPALAADELRRAVRSLGLRGAMIGSNVMGRNLDHPELEPIWAAASELNVPLLVHPVNVGAADRLGSYYLNNLIGNPLDTTIAAACLVFGGVLERHPGLNVCLVHGGGFVPYQAGRWAHGWHVREEPKVNLQQSPEPWIERFYYDTILHSRKNLEFLIGSAGATRVLLGSDYPYDMGTGECVRQVRALSIPETDKATVLSTQAWSLLGASPA